MENFKKITKLSFGVIVIFLLSIVVSIHLTAKSARAKGDQLVLSLKGKTEYQTIMNISEWTSKNFAHGPPYQHWINQSPLVNYTNLLSHRYLPKFLRLDRGAIEMHTLEGQCSHMSRFLEFLFNSVGIESEQHDIFSSKAGHSALSVKYKNEWVFIDPFLGFVMMRENELISLDEAQELIQNGTGLDELILPLREDVDLRLYENLSSFDHALMSDNVIIDINIVFNDKAKISLGKFNNDSRDTMSAGGKYNLTSHLHYVGPRYRRNMIFKFDTDDYAKENGYDLIFYTTEDIDPKYLPESNVIPEIEGNKLVYSVKNNKLKLFYGNMSWNLARLIKRKSWYDVDVVEIIKK